MREDLLSVSDSSLALSSASSRLTFGSSESRSTSEAHADERKDVGSACALCDRHGHSSAPVHSWRGDVAVQTHIATPPQLLSHELRVAVEVEAALLERARRAAQRGGAAGGVGRGAEAADVVVAQVGDGVPRRVADKGGARRLPDRARARLVGDGVFICWPTAEWIAGSRLRARLLAQFSIS